MTLGKSPQTILIGVVEHDDLQPIPRDRHLFAQKRKDLPHRDHIFIPPRHRVAIAIPGSSPRKIDLDTSKNRMICG